MGNLGMTELLVILAIVVLLFGTKRLGSLGSDLGTAIKGFRTAMKSDDGKDKLSAKEQPGDVIDSSAQRTEEKH